MRILDKNRPARGKYPSLGRSRTEAEQVRVEPRQELPDLRHLFAGGRLADGGQFLGPHEFRQVESRYVRLDHCIGGLNA